MPSLTSSDRQRVKQLDRDNRQWRQAPNFLSAESPWLLRRRCTTNTDDDRLHQLLRRSVGTCTLLEDVIDRPSHAREAQGGIRYRTSGRSRAVSAKKLRRQVQRAWEQHFFHPCIHSVVEIGVTSSNGWVASKVFAIRSFIMDTHHLDHIYDPCASSFHLFSRLAS